MNHDVIVAGAGIVGTACALELQKRGRKVLLLDAAEPGCGVTAAGMGHLVALNETQDELDFCLYSLRLWQRFLEAHPGIAEHSSCGTLWVAETDEQLHEAELRAARLNHHDWQAELLNASRVTALEPALRPGLKGAVRVMGDSVVYPPLVVQQLVREFLGGGGQLRTRTKVQAVHDDELLLEGGEKLSAPHIVIATANGTSTLLPEVPVFPRKGHLAITDRYPGRLSHQIVSMGYGQASMTEGGLTVAANIQPRATGQWLIGSCRQDGQADTALDMRALAAVLHSASLLLPELTQMRILRAWAGMRPATPDGHPLIGAHPGRTGVWLATGHEGLGVTTAFATAALLVDLMGDEMPAIDPEPYSVSRLFSGKEVSHG